MLFNFTLAPVREIAPWGDTLHWFGLTFGEYWIQVGRDALFEYTTEARAATGGTRYCDYQVSRLHEDVLNMCPHVLESVPDDLAAYLDFAHTDRWTALPPPPAEGQSWFLHSLEDETWATVKAASWWIGDRTLDNGYLTPGARIRLGSVGSEVWITWDNTGATLEGVQAFTATKGQFRMPREAFLAEVRSFHERLMAEMEERTRLVARDGIPGVEVDVAQLLREHAAWSGDLERHFGPPWEPTDWDAARAAIRKLDGAAPRGA